MSRIKSLLLMAAAMAATAESNAMFSQGGYSVKVDPEWKRKKCKSCKHFTASGRCYKSQRYRSKPTDSACYQYQKRK